MICQNCKTEIKKGAKFCPKCGSKADAKQPPTQPTGVCPKCGTKNPLGAKFCRVDGFDLSQAQDGKTDIKVSPKDAVICPSCGTPNPPTARFCRKDGSSLVKKATPEKEEESLVGMPEQESSSLKDNEEAAMNEQPPVEGESPIPDKPAQELPGITCPACGAMNPISAKFCRIDGAALTPGILEKPASSGAAQRKPAIGMSSKTEKPGKNKKLSKKGHGKPRVVAWLWILLIALLTAGGGLWGYTYYQDHIAVNPEKIQNLVNGELRTKGLSIYVEVGQDWVLRLKGFARSPAEKETAFLLAKSHKEIKNVVDEIILEKTPAEAQQTPVQDHAGGLPASSPGSLNNDITAKLKGDVKSRTDKTQSPGTAGLQREEVANVHKGQVKNEQQVPSPAELPSRKESSKIDRARLEGEINQAIRRDGISGVMAEVKDDMSVTLKGSVKSSGDKDRALRITRGFRPVKRVKDMIFVIEN